MLIKFLARGTGSARAAARYLFGERDAAGKSREGVEVLRGNPDMVAAVADTLAFEHRYTSGVIAWAPEDRPTDEQIEAVLDAFEKTAWAGLERDRYAWTAVLHREHGGGAHVHVLAARCDLETGRSLNIAPRAGRRPSAPSGTHSTTNTAGLGRTTRRGPEASPRDLIRDYLLQRVEHGTVRDRAEVVSVFCQNGRSGLPKWQVGTAKMAGKTAKMAERDV